MAGPVAAERGGSLTVPSTGTGSSSERLGAFLETIELAPLQKDMLRERWLSQLTWFSKQARYARRRFLALRMPVVLGSVAVPALVTLVLSSDANGVPWLAFLSGNDLRVLTFVVSLLVALLAATEELYHYGDRWRQYRRSAELLKSVGWQYLMLNGTFRRYQTHEAAFAPFTERVEAILNEDVEGYLSGIAADSGERPRHEVVA